MENQRNSFIVVLNYFLGILFIVSAISKLFPIHAFELTIVSQRITDWSLAPYLSRLIIGLEFFIGISFFFTNYKKKFVYPASFILLMVFNIHLLYSILTGHNADNCGCFGEFIPMTSVQALLKNLVLNLFLIYLFLKDSNPQKDNKIFTISSGVLTYVFLFIFFPIRTYITPKVESTETKKFLTDSVRHEIKTDSIIQPNSTETLIDTSKNIKTVIEENKENLLPRTKSVFSSYTNFNGKNVNLDEGIKTVALFSLDCDHCMESAKKYFELESKYTLPPLYILFLGEENQVNNFFNYAGKTYPYIILDVMEFFPFLNSSPPRIVLLNNGNIVLDTDSEKDILNSIKEKYSKAK
ncbi:MAG: hypothetical protein KF721_06285 [Ignavibacteriaceae bacterium]|nr:hypothetical protein [Ignavibacteriaceae bacterium]